MENIKTYDFGEEKDITYISCPQIEENEDNEEISSGYPVRYEIIRDWNKSVTTTIIYLNNGKILTSTKKHNENGHSPSSGGIFHYYYDENCCCTGNSTPWSSRFDTNNKIKDYGIVKLRDEYLKKRDDIRFNKKSV
jgi:hypothetical protein